MTQLEGLTDAQLQAEAAALRRRIKQLDDEKRALTPPTTPMRTPPAKKVVTVVPSSSTPKKVVPTSIPKSSPKPLPPPSPQLCVLPDGNFSATAWAGSLGLAAVAAEGLLENKPAGDDPRQYLQQLDEAAVCKLFMDADSALLQRLAACVWRGLEDLRKGVPVPASPVFSPEPVAAANGAAAAAAENGGSQSAGLWKQKVGPVLLRLRVQKAFQQAGAAHARKHAVDEADYERVGATPQESVAVAQVLGRVQPTLKQLLGPLVLKVRVARAFRGSAAPSWAEPAADVTDDAEPSADASAESSEIGEEEEDDESLFLLPKHLAGDLAITTARWALVAELQPTDTPPPSLCDALRTRIASLKQKEQQQQDSSSSSVGPSALSPSRARAAMVALDLLLAEMECWGTVGSVTDLEASAEAAAAQMDDGTAISMQLVSDAAPYVAAVVRAKRLIIDENAPAMSKHLESMWSEQMKDGESEVKKAGMRMRTVLKFRAQYIHRALTAAMDNLASQLQGGMEDALSQPQLSLPQSTAKADVASLCTAAISAFRVGFDRPWSLSSIEEELEKRCGVPPQMDEALKKAEEHAKAKAAAKRSEELKKGVGSSAGEPLQASAFHDEPAVALLGLLLGSKALPVRNEDELNFLTTTVASYLDPFIDGDAATSHKRQACAAKSLMRRLDEAWALRSGRGGSTAGRTMPITADCAYAFYAVHCIRKMNSIFGFALQTTFGIGRPPASSYEQMRHLMQLGSSLITALSRDFPTTSQQLPKHHAVSSGLTSLSAEEFTAIAQTHLRAMHGYHERLNAALVRANEEGEVNRAVERNALWKTPIDPDLLPKVEAAAREAEKAEAMSVEVAEPEKENGFFSWLTGGK